MIVNVHGLREVDQALAALASKTGTRIMRQSMYAAVSPIVAEAKNNVERIPNGSGALHLSIGKRFVISATQPAQMGSKFTVEIAPFKKNRKAIALHNLYYGRRRKGVFYGHLIEFGFAHVGGKSVPARPFLGPALRRKGPQAVSRLAGEIKTRIDRELKRLAK